MSACIAGPSLLRAPTLFPAATREWRTRLRQAALNKFIKEHELLQFLGREEHGGHYRCACPTGILIRELLATPGDSPFVVERRDGVVLFEGLAFDSRDFRDLLMEAS